MCSTRPRRRGGCCARAGAVWNDAGSRPRRPPAGSSRPGGRARMPGAWRPRRVGPGRRPRRPSRQYERSEAGWKIAHAALAVFRPEGRLNDRAWAGQQIALALPMLSGREWSKVRGLLQAEETLTFLDRLHRQLREAVPERSVACGVGAVVVAASAAAPSERHGARRGCGPCGPPGATGGLPEGGRELAGVVRCGVAGVASDGAGQQCGGVHEQRAADAPVAASDGEPGVAGPEAAVLELPRVSRGETASVIARMSYLGLKLPSYRFWDLLGMPTPSGGDDLTPRSVKFQTYGLGRSPRPSQCVDWGETPAYVTTFTFSATRTASRAAILSKRRGRPAYPSASRVCWRLARQGRRRARSLSVAPLSMRPRPGSSPGRA